MNKSILIYHVFLIVFVIGCHKLKKKEFDAQQKFTSSIPTVKIAKVKQSSFLTEIISNGKLEALKKVDLKFEDVGVIQKIVVNEGDYIKKGQLIAYQSSSHLLSETKKNKEVLAKAYLDMEDILLGFNYKLKDSLSIPKETMNMVRSRSGISEVKNQIVQTQKRYIASRVMAPFSGTIANLSAKEKSLSSTADKVCTLIDNTELLVSFFILEKEYGLVTKGDSVNIYPIAFPQKKFNGKVKHINPIVDENGLILIKASVENKENLLVDGMNVNVIIKNKINNTISIPKKAIVDREDSKVVFIYKNRKSQWRYVKLGIENKDSIVITEGLKIDDHIIINGNVNLAHDTKVNLIE
ncbi:efflux RND transporter periplasmic adaptor subunit [Aquimarina aggregata]|uniref:efflux RND transporter periplasmic adaptor subunit n=1 Tax=Aquimarina aggregata TaxID=1642818 RepID=UPI002491E6E2|nr:efflux RND transporter periplasmic adaptor subunit [Aquimarina aggregata]